jgi:phosphate starvation-inducible protein PhoH and related proteins
MSYPMSKKKQAATPTSPVFQLRAVKPVTINQNKAFKAFSSGQHILMNGCAGTGKSFLGCYLGLNEVDMKAQGQLVIIRSQVPSRNPGFLPGNEDEKAAVYEAPYVSIVEELYRKGGAYTRLKDTKVIDFETTSFLRGRTLDNAVLLVDEVQNMTFEEIDTVLTRVGQNTRVILCGDSRFQNDLKKETSGMTRLIETVSRMPTFSTVTMTVEDIVRSGFVKDWIIARGG